MIRVRWVEDGRDAAQLGGIVSAVPIEAHYLALAVRAGASLLVDCVSLYSPVHGTQCVLYICVQKITCFKSCAGNCVKGIHSTAGYTLW